MTGVMKLEYTALTYADAVVIATERYRLFMDDADATLPWATHFTITEEPGADDGSELNVTALIEFDRKATDAATSV